MLRVSLLFFRRRNKVTEAAATVTPADVETVSEFDSYTAARYTVCFRTALPILVVVGSAVCAFLVFLAHLGVLILAGFVCTVEGGVAVGLSGAALLVKPVAGCRSLRRTIRLLDTRVSAYALLCCDGCDSLTRYAAVARLLAVARLVALVARQD